MTRVLLLLSLLLSVLTASAAPMRPMGLSPLEGAEEIDHTTKYSKLDQAKKAAGWLRPPTKLPQGYEFKSAEISGETKEAWLRYSNYEHIFSIFQQHTDEDKTVKFQRVDGGWYWQDGKDRFLIAGLPEAQAKLVAESIK